MSDVRSFVAFYNNNNNNSRIYIGMTFQSLTSLPVQKMTIHSPVPEPHIPGKYL